MEFLLCKVRVVVEAKEGYFLIMETVSNGYLVSTGPYWAHIERVVP